MCKIVHIYEYCVIIASLLLKCSFSTYLQRNVYTRVTQEEQFLGFSGLINYNGEARMDLLEKELTIFIPTNNAFKNYGKPLHSDLAFYHMAAGARTLRELKSIQNISSVKENFPKLWITATSYGVFVNNAEIITFKSDYPGRTRNDNDQILHIIDDVLDPIIRNPKFRHTAYNFMVETEKWQLDANRDVASFFYKVKEHKIEHLFHLEGSNTYFIPVDHGIESYKFKKLDKNILFGHIIPGHVLFTRPTIRGVSYETMANDIEGIWIELALEDIDGRIYVKGSTFIGGDSNPQGDVIVEIIQPNIPVFNGVVHLISKPIGIFERPLKPFPYVPIKEKLATDPALATIYELGENTGFNKIFTTHNASFTYFVPNDFAWKQMKKKGLRFSGSDVDLLKRHLIISDFPYSMERLLALSSGRNYREVELKTVGGFLRLLVLEIEGNYYLRWSKTFIKVLRPNYECTDGLIHVLAGPIANLG